MTRRLPIGEAIKALMLTRGAALEFYILNGREATDAELAEFASKYNFPIEPACSNGQTAGLPDSAFRVQADDDDGPA